VKKQIQLFGVLILLSIISINAGAQAPNITYNPAIYNFTVGTNIGSIVPTNNGGSVPATTYGQVTTFAGNASGSTTGGYTNATGTAARFNFPQNIVSDASGNLYVGDYNNNAIRKITPAGVVTTFAGSTTGASGSTNGTGTAARFKGPEGMAIDGAGNLYVGDFDNNLIRKITPAGVVTTFASGALIQGPAGICFDGAGNLYVAEQNGATISKITSAGVVSTYAGSGTSGFADNANKLTARFDNPIDVQVDASGNVFVADYNNNRIREITTAGAVVTFAGSGTTGSTDGTGTAARFNTPTGIAMDAAGNFYIADYGNNLIREITPAGVVTTVAGSGSGGNVDGITTAAQFYSPIDLYIDNSGTAYITDGTTHNIRKMSLTGFSISPSLPAGLSFDGTTGTISGTTTSPFAATVYTITAYNAYGSSSATVTLGCGRTIVWTGGSNSNWNRATNWSTNSVPGSADNVEIGTATFPNNRQPVINTDVTVNSITFGTFRNPITLTVGNNNTARTLTVSGNITVNQNAIAEITANNVNRQQVLVMSPGSTISVNSTGAQLTISTASFTLQSDATGSASVGPVTATNFITSGTTVNVERYVTGGSAVYRMYRMMSSPVYAGTVSGNHVYNLDYIQASALITGAAGGGFDKTGNPTLYLYREDAAPNNSAFGAGNWPGISKINNNPTYNLQLNGAATNYNLMPGSGFLFFFRGDRTTNFANKYTPGTAAESVTFTATGTLNVGQIVAKDWYTPTSSNLGYTSVAGNGIVQGFNLVGNPYPSNIDWDTYQTSSTTTGMYGKNLDGIIYMLDPISKNYGAYPSGSGGIGTNNVTNIIPSGAGFFVRANATNAQLIFNESAKTTTQAVGANLMLGTPVASAPLQYFRIRMSKDNINTDETMVRINSSCNGDFINGVDALYRPGSGGVSLASISKDRYDIAIKSLPLPKLQAETLSLDVNATTNGIYTLTLRDIVAIPNLYDVWLMDNYKADSLDMRQNKTYSFYIDKTDSATFGNKRFYLVIRQNPAYAYHLLDFTASKLSELRQVQAVWRTRNEENYTNFTLERSTDNGATFSTLGGITSTGAGAYSFIDKNPVNGTNLYRLKQEDINNLITYSKIVTVQYANPANGIVSNLGIYPNPVSNTIHLSIVPQNNDANTYNIRITSSSGLLVKQTTSSQPTWQGSISDLQPGTYVVRVFDNKTQNLVGENKFVKL
jgi:hypothetical protein